MKFAKLIKRFRIEKAHGFKLADFDPADTCGMDISKSTAKDMIADGLRHLTTMQEKLYAQNRWALLIVLQGMDASGKDGVVKHVMSGFNPQGCEVHAFRAPTAEELEHDFPLACRQAPAGARTHRHLQPLLLRGCAGGARQARTVEASEPAAGARDQGDLVRTLQEHPRLRASSRPKRHRVAEVSPAHFSGGTAPAPARAAGRAGQALEILHERRRRPQTLGPIHGCIRGCDPQYRDRRGPVVRDAGRPEMVRLADGRGCDCGCDGTARSKVPGGQRQGARRAREGAAGAGAGLLKALFGSCFRTQILLVYRHSGGYMPRRLTDSELAEIRRRRPGVRASLACEGMYLTAEEEALFDQMERERLTPDERAKRITQINRAKRRV